MDHQDKIRLKVSTETGLNILCTAHKEWRVSNLYIHLSKLYKEVTLQENELPKNSEIEITKIMKDEYLIPRSQIIGEIFHDGDEIYCGIGIKKLEDKKKRISNKKDQKQKQLKNGDKKRQSEQSRENKKDKNKDENKNDNKGEKKKEDKKEFNNKQSVKAEQENNKNKNKSKKKNKNGNEKKNLDKTLPPRPIVDTAKLLEMAMKNKLEKSKQVPLPQKQQQSQDKQEED